MGNAMSYGVAGGGVNLFQRLTVKTNGTLILVEVEAKVQCFISCI